MYEVSILPFRKESINQNAACIYGFCNQKTNEWYVGQSITPVSRIRAHLSTSKCTLFYNVLRKERGDFKLFILEENHGKMDTIMLIGWLNDREKHWISHYNSFEEGYNLTKGGTCTKSEVETFKMIKMSLSTFKLHRVAVEWFCKREGSLQNCNRSYVIRCPENPSINGIKLGEMIHKWRSFTSSYVLRMPENMDFLIKHGFTLNTENLTLKKPGQWNVWRKCMMWVFEQHGHVNISKDYIMPIESPFPKKKFGCFISNMRNRDNGITPFHSDIRTTFRLMKFMTVADFLTFQIKEGFKYYLLDFTKFNKLPHHFTFPSNYRVLYLRDYCLGCNFSNLMRRRFEEGCIEYVRYKEIRTDVIRFLILLQVKTGGLRYKHALDEMWRKENSAALQCTFEPVAITKANLVRQWAHEHQNRMPRQLSYNKNKSLEEDAEHQLAAFVSEMRSAFLGKNKRVSYQSVNNILDDIWGDSWRIERGNKIIIKAQNLLAWSHANGGRLPLAKYTDQEEKRYYSWLNCALMNFRRNLLDETVVSMLNCHWGSSWTESLQDKQQNIARQYAAFIVTHKRKPRVYKTIMTPDEQQECSLANWHYKYTYKPIKCPIIDSILQ